MMMLKKTFFEGQVEAEIEVTPKTTLNPKIVPVMKNLQSSYIEDANKIVKQALIDLATIAVVAKDTKSTKDKPQTFKEALNHPNFESQKIRQEEIWKEFNNMKKQQV